MDCSAHVPEPGPQMDRLQPVGLLGGAVPEVVLAVLLRVAAVPLGAPRRHAPVCSDAGCWCLADRC
jgi:hypothetical protein